MISKYSLDRNFEFAVHKLKVQFKSSYYSMYVFKFVFKFFQFRIDIAVRTFLSLDLVCFYKA